jgi:hypothetical protein
LLRTAALRRVGRTRLAKYWLVLRKEEISFRRTRFLAIWRRSSFGKMVRDVLVGR